MRLINVETLEMREFFESNIPKYAILSHTWGDEEISFLDWQTISSLPELLDARPSGVDDAYTNLQRRKVETLRRRAGYKKALDLCCMASKDTLKWAWIDTCCIDKTSSSELSEAINSMFRYYQMADICYVYLADVLCPAPQPSEDLKAAFSSSRWFTRGWTLQELLAPAEVSFFDAKWRLIGQKRTPDLVGLIAKRTGISADHLCGLTRLADASISNRMSWASERQTTRTEDMAYCLMGIFDVHMPLLYGEGEHAFIRLQEEILKTSTDHTIFAWGFGLPVNQENVGPAPDFTRLLAPSPAYFAGGAALRDLDMTRNHSSQMTNKGLNITLGIWPFVRRKRPLYFASLLGTNEPVGFLLHRGSQWDVGPASEDISNGDTLRRVPTGGPVFGPLHPDVALGAMVTRSIFIPRYSSKDTLVLDTRLNLVLSDHTRSNTRQLPWRIVEVFPPLHTPATQPLRIDDNVVFTFMLHDDWDGPEPAHVLHSSLWKVKQGFRMMTQRSEEPVLMTWHCWVGGPVSFILGLQVRGGLSRSGTVLRPKRMLQLSGPTNGMSLLAMSTGDLLGEAWHELGEQIHFLGTEGLLQAQGGFRENSLEIRITRVMEQSLAPATDPEASVKS